VENESDILTRVILNLVSGFGRFSCEGSKLSVCFSWNGNIWEWRAVKSVKLTSAFLTALSPAITASCTLPLKKKLIKCGSRFSRAHTVHRKDISSTSVGAAGTSPHTRTRRDTGLQWTKKYGWKHTATCTKWMTALVTPGVMKQPTIAKCFESPRNHRHKLYHICCIYIYPWVDIINLITHHQWSTQFGT